MNLTHLTKSMRVKRAHLTAQIPSTRFRSFDGSAPRIGDLVELDQGFTFPDGKPGCLVYCKGEGGLDRYEAEVYESEIGPDVAA